LLLAHATAVIENMSTWHHSGFHVYCGDVIRPDDEEGLEHLAHYIIRGFIFFGVLDGQSLMC